MSFIQNLNTELDQQHLLQHVFYQAWNKGELTLEYLRTYAGQYFHHVEAFIPNVAATYANCPSETARATLKQNLLDEQGLSGNGDGSENHPELWLRFAEGIGEKREHVKNAQLLPETKNLIAVFTQLANSSYAEGVGALYAYERQIPAVAASKIDGLKKFYGIDSSEALKFFTVHLEADVHHSNATNKLLEDLSATEQLQAAAAAKQVAAALWGFLDGMQRVIENPLVVH